MKFGYIRVSTQNQNTNRQIDQLLENGIHKANLYIDKETGTKLKRRSLDKLLEVVEPGDTIIVTELARLSRSTKDLISISERLNKKEVELVSLKENIDTSTANGC